MSFILKRIHWFKYILITILSSQSIAHTHGDDPWFTEPLFALAGKALPLGTSSIELYGYYIPNTAIYDINWHPVPSTELVNSQFAPEISYGLTDHMDVELDLLYVFNQYRNVNKNNIGDTDVLLGYQFLDQEKSNNIYPSGRITIEEIFPTGRFDELDPANFGADGIGEGSYQTMLGLNFEYLFHFKNHHLNAHACIFYNMPSSVHLHGFSVYGGTPETRGTIQPGNALTLDFAGELTLTQHWVAVFETMFSYQSAARFRGILGGDAFAISNYVPTEHHLHQRHMPFRRLIPRRINIGNTIGSGNSDEFTLAPAIEYNFSSNMGIIGGAWFTIAGKNTPQFVATVIALTKTWE